METKSCKSCQQEKPINAFRERKNRTTIERRAICLTCEKAKEKAARDDPNGAYQRHQKANREKILLRQRKNTYLRWGLTIEAIDALMAYEQNHNGMCDLCGEPLVKEGRRGVNADHCHDTNKFRGILCDSCNLGLGKFKDSPRLLMLAIDYLGRAPIA